MFIATNKKDFLVYFKAEYLSGIKRQEIEWQGTYNTTIDRPFRRETWNNLIDSYVRDRQLPRKAMDWCCPW